MSPEGSRVSVMVHVHPEDTRSVGPGVGGCGRPVYRRALSQPEAT